MKMGLLHDLNYGSEFGCCSTDCMVGESLVTGSANISCPLTFVRFVAIISSNFNLLCRKWKQTL